jgi:hypothetical protein
MYLIITLYIEKEADYIHMSYPRNAKEEIQQAYQQAFVNHLPSPNHCAPPLKLLE